MGLIKYGPLADEVSGTVGGVTFARVRGAKACRIWRAPVNKRTNQQRLRRLVLARTAQEWFDDRSAAQRTAWDTYAATCTFQNPLGENYTISGYNMYVRNRGWREMMGIGTGTTAPVGTGFPAALTVGFTLTHATGVLQYASVAPALDATGYISFEIFSIAKVTRNYPTGVKVAGVAYMNNPALPLTIHTYGALPGIAGEYRSWIRWRYVDGDNRLSLPTYQYRNSA